MPEPGAELLCGEHEEVHFLADPASGLRAIVAIHDTSRGPALGGTRCRRYDSEAEALEEVLRLSRAMTYKTALAGIPAGGGKAVVMARPEMDRPEAFRALGRFVELLQGRFFTSSDLGTRDEDVRELASVTRFVTDPGRGDDRDLALRTAEGVFAAAGTCLDLFGIAEWHGIRIVIQGMGKIGLHLATMAARAGAVVLGSEVDMERVSLAEDTLGVQLVPPEEVYEVPCDVFAPCAVGGTLTPATIERLHCRAVVGAANEQLESLECADLLDRRGILYAPDFVVNAGAVIVGCRRAVENYAPPADMNCIARTLRTILLESLETKTPPYRVALRKAEERWRADREERVRARRAL